MQVATGCRSVGFGGIGFSFWGRGLAAGWSDPPLPSSPRALRVSSECVRPCCRTGWVIGYPIGHVCHDSNFDHAHANFARVGVRADADPGGGSATDRDRWWSIRPVLQAPMAQYTNFAFRQVVRQYGGAGLLATEMVSARSFVWRDERAETPDRLWGVTDEPRPLAVQMWDNDPETMARVGRRLAGEYGVSVVDINFGCPVKQVTEKAHSGSYLLRTPAKMAAIIERVVAACAPTPVTAKIRLGCAPDCINHREVARVVEASGAAALTVHGRVASQFFKGTADWDRIAELADVLTTIPLIGNGDLDSAGKVVAAFNRYPRRRGDDRSGVSRPAVAVRPGGGGAAG